MCPMGKDNKQIDNQMPAQEVNYRLRLRRNLKIPEVPLPPCVGIPAAACSTDSERTTQTIF